MSAPSAACNRAPFTELRFAAFPQRAQKASDEGKRSQNNPQASCAGEQRDLAQEEGVTTVTVSPQALGGMIASESIIRRPQPRNKSGRKRHF